ncbi:MAG: 6-phosphofructokinase [Candidatus Omnitrophota bacterium]
MKRLAVFTSGGDAPGMNAAIRAVVRVGLYHGLEVFGIMRGYQGLIQGEFVTMGPRSVSNIVHRGGTILKTSRSKEFETEAGRRKAKRQLENFRIDALIAIGGNGTYRGAIELGKIWKGRMLGAPGTIDNDLYGTDFTIGYDTANNTAVEAIDKIRDTADSHERVFIVEVMGRDAGFIALEVGIGGGAEEVLIPETKTSIAQVARHLKEAGKKGKTSSILIVSEGDEEGGAYDVAKKLEARTGQSFRVLVLGHLQRGGSPTALDRRLATELGAYAVEQAIAGKTGVAVGLLHGRLALTPLREAVEKKKTLDPYLLKILPALAS